MNSNDAQTLKDVGAAVAPVLTGIAAYWKARKAEKYAKPTGNGFARTVLDSLARIEHRQDKDHKKLKKIDRRLTAVENREPASDPNPPAAG